MLTERELDEIEAEARALMALECPVRANRKMAIGGCMVLAGVLIWLMVQVWRG